MRHPLVIILHELTPGGIFRYVCSEKLDRTTGVSPREFCRERLNAYSLNPGHYIIQAVAIDFDTPMTYAYEFDVVSPAVVNFQSCEERERA